VFALPVLFEFAASKHGHKAENWQESAKKMKETLFIYHIKETAN
jgi:hypothetical protein